MLLPLLPNVAIKNHPSSRFQEKDRVSKIHGHKYFLALLTGSRVFEVWSARLHQLTSNGAVHREGRSIRRIYSQSGDVVLLDLALYHVNNH